MPGARAALEALKQNPQPFPLVLTDLVMPDGSGIDVLSAAKQRTDATEVIVMTAHSTVEAAIEAMRKGAYDFVTKPFSPAEIAAIAQKALEKSSLVSENQRLKAHLERLEHDGREPLGLSPAMARVGELIDKIAPTRTTVLITGESGTGKERVARLLHERSDRAQPALRGGQLRRPAGGADGERALRPREGRVHGRGRALAGALPRGRGRHAPPRRGGRAAGAAPGQAAPRPAGAQGARRRRRRGGGGGRARARRHQPRRRGRRAAEQVPPGPLLPAQRHPHRAAPPARSAGGRLPPRRALRAALRGGARQGRARAHRRRAARARRATPSPATCASWRT